jgi:hypothetical protein
VYALLLSWLLLVLVVAMLLPAREQATQNPLHLLLLMPEGALKRDCLL